MNPATLAMIWFGGALALDVLIPTVGFIYAMATTGSFEEGCGFAFWLLFLCAFVTWLWPAALFLFLLYVITWCIRFVVTR